MPERYAIYYAPASEAPLGQLSAGWLGRDPSGREIPQANLPGLGRERLDRLSAAARRYGFHATLKAPMGLALGTSREDLTDALARFARTAPAVDMGIIELTLIDGFLALVPRRQTQDLTEFAQRVVEAFEPFRAPPSLRERERRLGARLTDRQVALYERYGYPYVLEQFRLHMTLTDRLAAGDRDAVVAAARDWFAPILTLPMSLDRLVLFHEPEPGAEFRRLDEFPLEG